ARRIPDLGQRQIALHRRQELHRGGQKGRGPARGRLAIQGSRLDLWLALPFGILGYLFKKLGYPIAPRVLAMVLGDKTEDAFRQSMIMSKGSLSIFWTNSSLVAWIMALAMLLLFWPLIGWIIRRLFKSGGKD
ncbi:MAG: hypothetical protein LBQ62_07855, partial [Candidatus Accumulibacter sp.]|nr:hypothetical protein [Accumulibacter sp.]